MGGQEGVDGVLWWVCWEHEGCWVGSCEIGLKCTCGYTLATSPSAQSPVPGPYRARARRGWPGVVELVLMNDDGCHAGMVGRTALTFETRRVGQVAVVYRNWIVGVSG